MGRLHWAGPGLAAGQVRHDLERALLPVRIFKNKNWALFFFKWNIQVFNIDSNWNKNLNDVGQIQSVGCTIYFEVYINFKFSMKSSTWLWLCYYDCHKTEAPLFIITVMLYCTETGWKVLSPTSLKIKLFNVTKMSWKCKRI